MTNPQQVKQVFREAQVPLCVLPCQAAIACETPLRDVGLFNYRGPTMSTTLQASHELIALDLLQVRVDDLTLDELEAHIERAGDTVLGLVGRQIDSPLLSPETAANIRRREQRLREHIQYVRELIDLHKLEAVAAEVDRQGREREAEERASAPRHMRL